MDQPTEQIEQFITMLRTTGAQVEDGLHHVESDTAALDHLAGELHDQLAGLSHELEGLLSELAHDEQAAASEIDHLGEAAHAVADTRFAAAQDHLEHAESSLNQALEGVRGQLDHDAAALHDQGFQPFAATLHSIDAALAASRSEADHAFEALDAALQTLGTQLEEATGEVDQALEEATKALGEEDAHQLQADASECVSGVNQLGPEVDNAATAMGESSQQIYAVWGSESETEAREVEDTLTRLYQDLEGAVNAAGTEKVLDPAEQVGSAAVPGLMDELGEQVSTLEAAQQTVAELPPLAFDLEITKAVVDQIDELAKAMSQD